MNNKTAAATLTKAANRVFDMAKKQSDPGMMAMYAGDARDMLSVARMLKEGKVYAALRKAQDMDTAARDEIPVKVWMFLTENQS